MELYDNRFNYIENEEDIIPAFKDDGYDLFEQNTTEYQETEKCIIKLKNKEKYYEVTVNVTMVGSWQDVGDKLYTIDSIDEVTFKEISYEKLVKDFNKKINDKIDSLKREINVLKSKKIEENF
jgi:hypothetical protein